MLWVNEYVGGARISFEAPGISFWSRFVCRPGSEKIEHESHLAVYRVENESKSDKDRTRHTVAQEK